MEHNRRNWLTRVGLAIASIGLAKFNSFAAPAGVFTNTFNNDTKNQKEHLMKLGAFSISLTVKDLHASQKFYESLGFKVFGGAIKSNYLIMKNGNALVGLFQGMFEKNILTFNPGWDENAQTLDVYEDVREIQRRLKEQGVTLLTEADEKTTGPASIMLMDPDGNPVLIDQHI